MWTPRFSLSRSRIQIEQRLKRIRAPLFKLMHMHLPWFECPVCGYRGPFKPKRTRLHAKCPRCGELERTRLQTLVLDRILSDFEPRHKCILHIAPEPNLKIRFQKIFDTYVSADLRRRDVDCQFDVQSIPFPNATFDFVFASHVLEYPEDDRRAIREFRRILVAGGVAILPVPLMHERTVDLDERDPVSRVCHEPGLDYFKRMRAEFTEVTLYRSNDFMGRFQPYILNSDKFMRVPSLRVEKSRYVDIVPVCRA